MDMKKMRETTVYKCAVCGEVYNSIAQRMNCEQSCLKKQEEEERIAAEAKKAAEYESRLYEVNAAFDKAYDLKDKLVRDYGGVYVYRKNVSNALDSNNVFHWFGL